MGIIEQKLTDKYAVYNGDCVEVTRGLKDDSVDLSIYSPPFCGLYNYSSDERDMSNNATYEGFFEHYEFLVKEMARVTKPGRINVVHATDIPVPGQKDGYYDLPGELIKMHQKHGFMFFGRVAIWKEPLRVAIRTRLKHLTHKQLVKDSTESTIAAADYILIFKRLGQNKIPVSHDYGLYEYCGEREIPEEILVTKGEKKQQENRLSQWIWRQYASSVWDDIRIERVLKYKEARDPEDEKHVHPLQLDVIERCVHMWSNPGEIVFTPFMGVGSEVYGAVVNERKGIGVELKPSYYQQAVKNLLEAETIKKSEVQGLLFEVA